MADVFISYSKVRRALTEALARHLEAEGFSVWWDTDLLPADNFRAEINHQLDIAKAVVIVWTPESKSSEWVCAEADRAHEQRKLVNTHSAGLAPRQIPMPFNQIHSVPIENREAIMAAVRKLCGRSAQKKQRASVTDPQESTIGPTERAERTQEFIWRPQHAAQYTTFGVVKFGDPVTVKVAPTMTTDANGTIMVFQKGVVVRTR
jgi:TIR domain-containing protein